MSYKELHNEYVTLLKDKSESQSVLASLKAGYISAKTISGKKYYYLQYRVDGKLKSEYIRESNLPAIKAELDERAHLHVKIIEIDDRLGKIEAAADILDKQLRQRLITLRRCAAMDTMPFGERSKSLAFSSAMTALEGLPVSEEIERNLDSWANGVFSFQESYLNTLRAYSFMEA